MLHSGRREGGGGRDLYVEKEEVGGGEIRIYVEKESCGH